MEISTPSRKDGDVCWDCGLDESESQRRLNVLGWAAASRCLFLFLVALL